MPPPQKRLLEAKRRTKNACPYIRTNSSTSAPSTNVATNSSGLAIQHNAHLFQTNARSNSTQNLQHQIANNAVDLDFEYMEFDDSDVSVGRDYSPETKIANLRIQESLIIKQQAELMESTNAKLFEIEMYKRKIYELEQNVNENSLRLSSLNHHLVNCRNELIRLGSAASNFVTGAASAVANFFG